ncbi:MAG: hypothetical protein CR997_12065 [Acidobacteria bacterium]|nr:MAG: hypothetical protein CR997_12065 [Acidobacteriota bacterium]
MVGIVSVRWNGYDSKYQVESTNMKKWLIVQAYWYFDEITGEFHYRVEQPSRGLRETGQFEVINVHIFHPFFPHLAETADLLILHLLPDAEITAVIKHRRQKGLPTVFEMADNFLEVGPWVADEDAHRNPIIRQNFLYHAALCDALQLNTTRLQGIFGSINDHILLYENQMDVLAPVQKKTAPFTIGWGGSIGHRTDLIRIKHALKDFLLAHDDVHFAYMGQEELFRELFNDFPSEKTSVTPAGPVNAYYDFLKNLHVGIAPLQDTGFNYCRSDIKHLEYAAAGAASLLSKAPAYLEHLNQNGSAFFFDSPDEFKQKLESLYLHREQIQPAVEATQRYIKSRRWWLNQAELKKEHYLQLIKTEPGVNELPEFPVPQSLMTHVRLGIHHMDAQNFDQSLHYFNQAIELLPAYHQAHYWKRELLLQWGKNSEVIKSLESYQANAIYQPLAIQQLCAAVKTEMPDQYEQLFAQIDDPLLQYSLEPERFQPEDLLAVNPYHYFSIRQLAAKILQERKASPDYQTCLEWGHKMDPENTDIDECLKRYFP